MGAFDVAIAEAAIGAGITGALLLAAWNRIKPSDEEVHPSQPPSELNDQEPQ
jgi:hypothetical protein